MTSGASVVGAVALLACAGCSREARDPQARPATGAVAKTEVASRPTSWQDHRALWRLVHQWARFHGPATASRLRDLHAAEFRGTDLRVRGFATAHDLTAWAAAFFGEGDELDISRVEIETGQDPGSRLAPDQARVWLSAEIDEDGWEVSRSTGQHQLSLVRRAGGWRIIGDQIDGTSPASPKPAPLAGNVTAALHLAPDDRLLQLTLTGADTRVVDLDLDVSDCAPVATGTGELYVQSCGPEPINRLWVRIDRGPIGARLLVERGRVGCAKCRPADAHWFRHLLASVPLADGARVTAQ